MSTTTEFAVVLGKRKEGVNIEEDDLVLVTAKKFPIIHEKVCFFARFLIENVIEFNIIGYGFKLFSLPEICGVEIVARKKTRQHEILTEVLLQKHNLQKRIDQIDKNFAELLCK